MNFIFEGLWSSKSSKALLKCLLQALPPSLPGPRPRPQCPSDGKYLHLRWSYTHKTYNYVWNSILMSVIILDKRIYRWQERESSWFENFHWVPEEEGESVCHYHLNCKSSPEHWECTEISVRTCSSMHITSVINPSQLSSSTCLLRTLEVKYHNYLF